MATPSNAPYKLAQRAAESRTEEKMVFISGHGMGAGVTAKAVREGKMNKKHGRRLAVRYEPF